MKSGMSLYIVLITIRTSSKSINEHHHGFVNLDYGYWCRLGWRQCWRDMLWLAGCAGDTVPDGQIPRRTSLLHTPQQTQCVLYLFFELRIQIFKTI